jgi:hypothetical protein
MPFSRRGIQSAGDRQRRADVEAVPDPDEAREKALKVQVDALKLEHDKGMVRSTERSHGSLTTLPFSSNTLTSLLLLLYYLIICTISYHGATPWYSAAVG